VKPNIKSINSSAIKLNRFWVSCFNPTYKLQAVLADFDNGDNSNIRRVFGFTTLFQPKEKVWRQLKRDYPDTQYVERF
jgi:hypothetical protein